LPALELMTIPRAAERLSLSPLKLFILLKLHLGSDADHVADAQMRILAEKLGLEIADAEGDRPEDWLNPTTDTNQRRRVTRYLLSKLQRQHRWWPNNCASDVSLRHGVPEHDKGVMRDARDSLVRCGWLKLQPVRRKITETNFGLNLDHRDDIISFVSTGHTEDPILLSWFEH
jgi:hypothetical protein